MAVTVQNVVDQLMEPVQKLDYTVDSLKFGDPAMEVKGIVTAFMATHEVIEQAVERGANLIITHEGLFFSHHDNTDSGFHSPVYKEKLKLIEDSKIAIFRIHDYIHRYQPDSITLGLVSALGWTPYVKEHKQTSSIITLPAAMTVKEIVEYVKRKLQIEFVRVAGDASKTCTRIGLLVGYRGGGSLSIPLYEEELLDLIIAGEGPEWETPEYIRDAVYQGRKKALIFLGHAESEEPGMRYLAEWLKTLFPEIPITFIQEKAVFQVI